MPHISFSALKDWDKCPYKFKLVWVDRVDKFAGNEHTTFGNAMHSVVEYQVQDKKPEGFKDWNSFFEEEFIKFIKGAYKNGAPKFDKKLITEMREQGKKLIPLAMPALKEKFGQFKLFGSELQLMEPIEGHENIKFKGFVDLVIGTKDKLHVIDWKTCSWGWDARKRSDKMIVYQLILYKYFLAKKLDLDPNNIDVHFALLKRTAKKDHVEFVDVTSGKIRTKNAVEMLNKAVSQYEKSYFPKNKLSCEGCQFRKSKWCP